MDNSPLNEKVVQLIRSLGVCWCTIAVYCYQTPKSTQKSTWITLGFFHGINSLVMWSEPGGANVDILVSGVMGSICVACYLKARNVSQLESVSNK